MSDVLIVGGGVIGLSLAYELSGRGRSVTVLDQGPLGQESSWAGAGMLPAAGRRPDLPPLDRLAALSNELHAAWSETLRAETGVDNGYRRCGGLYLAFDDNEAQSLAAVAERWQRDGVAAERLDERSLGKLEPHLDLRTSSRAAAWLLPDEAQVRNPRHLAALIQACGRRGVRLEPHAAAERFERSGDRVTGVLTPRGRFSAASFCLAGGAWSGKLAEALGAQLAVEPVRGQIALLSPSAVRLARMINVGHDYLVPRPDGRVLVGSTMERVGFDKRTTTGAIAGLLQFAVRLAPGLAEAPLERCWAGLRPASADGLPYLGPLPGWSNVLAATGHFRAGLQLSTGTARVLAQLLCGEHPEIDLSPFSPARPAAPSAE